MDKEFTQNQLKPTDPGFVYDKRVEFKRGETLENDSWGEESDRGANLYVEEEDEEDMDYFDDDFS